MKFITFKKMNDNQEHILIKSIELRHYPWINKIFEPNILENKKHRAFNLVFNSYIDRVSMLIHFKELRILEMELYYRKKSADNRKKRKAYPQHKMRVTFNNTLELLNYLSKKNYKVDWFNIKFKNGWSIKNYLINGLEFITNNPIERNVLIEKLITISGQVKIDINSLEINQTYTLSIDGKVKHEPFAF